MRCPVDNETLIMADRNGVEIDYCPKCRGVWLDRGELDKIIDRAASAASSPTERPQTERPQTGAAREIPEPARTPTRRRDDDDDDDYDRRGKPHRRRESFLSDLFDF
jgi:uncharacterized protein